MSSWEAQSFSTTSNTYHEVIPTPTLAPIYSYSLTTLYAHFIRLTRLPPSHPVAPSFLKRYLHPALPQHRQISPQKPLPASLYFDSTSNLQLLVSTTTNNFYQFPTLLRYFQSPRYVFNDLLSHSTPPITSFLSLSDKFNISCPDIVQILSSPKHNSFPHKSFFRVRCFFSPSNSQFTFHPPTPNNHQFHQPTATSFDYPGTFSVLLLPNTQPLSR